MHCVCWDPDAPEELCSYLSNASDSNTRIRILCPLCASQQRSLHYLEQSVCNLENCLSAIPHLVTVATNNNATITASSGQSVSMLFMPLSGISETIE